MYVGGFAPQSIHSLMTHTNLHFSLLLGDMQIKESFTGIRTIL